MRAFEIAKFGRDGLAPARRPMPSPGPAEVLVRLKSASLNYRDVLLLQGGYNPKEKLPIIPLSDGVGEVVALGAGASGFRPGDRVVNNFFQGWLGGGPDSEKLATALGAFAIDGLLCEYRVFDEKGLVPAPDYLSDAEVASLPCAGLTAWSAIVTLGRVRPGEVVLIQGTGGVSLFALQFAKMAGAAAIVTSSSDAKLDRATALGADHVINYVREPDWGRAARRIAGGGVDHIVEVGGAGTLAQSLKALRIGGTISMIGVLAGASAQLNIPAVVMQQLRLQGVTVGSREGFIAMLRAMHQAKMRPILDQNFAFDQAPAAFARMSQAEHFGKITIAF